MGSKDSCAKKAREGGYPGFAFGKEEAFGSCYGEVIRVTQKYFDKYELDGENPAPACGWKILTSTRMSSTLPLWESRKQSDDGAGVMTDWRITCKESMTH